MTQSRKLQPKAKVKEPPKARAPRLPKAIPQQLNPVWERPPSAAGRKKLFDDPELMLERMQEYFREAATSPVYEVIIAGGMATRKEVPKSVPFTMAGLCIYLNASEDFLRVFLHKLNNDDVVTVTAEQKERFIEIIQWAQMVIKNQKIQGAAARIFDPNFISREMGIYDNKRIELEGEINGKQEHTITGPLEVVFVNSGAPLADRESDIDTTR